MAVTLLELRNAAKDLSDMQNSPEVGDTTWNRWINDGIEKLWRIVTKTDVGGYQTFQNFTISTGNTVALPAGFRRLLGVTRDPGAPGMRRSLPKYNMGERDFVGPLGPLSYRLIGQTIAIEPSTNAAGNYAMYYIAGPTVLANDSDAIDTVLEQYDDYVTTWAAIKALGKEESDTRDLYQDFYKLEADIAETLAMRDGDDASTIVDDDARGPAWPWAITP